MVDGAPCLASDSTPRRRLIIWFSDTRYAVLKKLPATEREEDTVARFVQVARGVKTHERVRNTKQRGYNTRTGRYEHETRCRETWNMVTGQPVVGEKSAEAPSR